eukprot:CAMPEP_0118950176 /NCGR_PEP_ID=MMETSP1169-20130426/50912_1 /TAXON_ID=36882 /ORGANISM="Pyramimonas obovata, Strain CCMP722" /LENGTH=187 /DNA_ID=CAMNT_0006896961 /DNA_START=30 /DNA_END=593 /DNA_ORIENTATION=-
MTYEEIVVCYNTEHRTDHSSRYKEQTPFKLLSDVEDLHNWQLERVVGIRSSNREGKWITISIAGVYRGFELVEWTDFAPYRDTYAWKQFSKQADAAEVEAVMQGRKAYYVLEGFDPEGVNVLHPFLEKGDRAFAKMRARYDAEKEKGLIKGAQKAKAVKRTKRVEAEESSDKGDNPEGFSDEDDSDL